MPAPPNLDHESDSMTLGYRTSRFPTVPSNHRHKTDYNTERGLATIDIISREPENGRPCQLSWTTLFVQPSQLHRLRPLKDVNAAIHLIRASYQR
ncbi:hypothetical protein PHYBLDRAFT_143107 [Phycomyces blakesleeanus NRRL 1555(-)]|uniref:Uncharacterized protein n=1 Tax=Phycomyces blakesleeanus (strain ATCC 8743b / DSM 1359 / FGSC 10004 / NBRC 33097 / NRRL 1555) TaxID=763407 RepID=A0A162ULC7_PHYB8|nr:hypothetical protein PHYBLDRAFT_143107 [Phycomyces blakesleeanus NRRL 1555(-)]OAD76123.1 hypothetical protein PHYBLDRAFT_143107 [Phycomyces blakesleeanus NRRL 1555(-)]|eukprot:XP_018294163.1 hypothetical protein PHYBLDRAFT_143107 [Phycomyces blakesleeanus NRRL 1555(-)]